MLYCVRKKCILSNTLFQVQVQVHFDMIWHAFNEHHSIPVQYLIRRQIYAMPIDNTEDVVSHLAK